MIGSFYIDTWKCSVCVVCPATPANLKSLLRRRYDVETKIDDNWDGMCIDTHKNGIIIALRQAWKKNPDALSILTHECHHAADMILIARGLEPSKKTREAFAYTAESIMRRAVKLLDKK